MVGGEDRSSSGPYPVFGGCELSLPRVVQSRVDADEVTGRHADATVDSFHRRRENHFRRHGCRNSNMPLMWLRIIS